MNIITKRMCIRNLYLDDLDDFHSYRSQPEVTKYQGFDIMNKNQSLEFIKSQSSKSFGVPGDWIQYGIEEIQHDKLIGDCAIKLEKNDPRIAQIGITINPGYQRNYFAKEAMTGIITWLFDNKKVQRISEIVDVENINSIKLLESLEFRKEGHFIENIFFNGKWGSEYQYAMLKREWKNK